MEFENRFALVVSLIIVTVSYYFNVHDNFNEYVDLTNNINITLLGTNLGALALTFSGIVFWFSLIDKKFEDKLIEYTGDLEVVDRFYASYLFLVFNILCLSVLIIITIITINSNLTLVGKKIFYPMELLYFYLVFYVWAYLGSLIKNVVDLIRVRANIQDNKSLLERANEVRIDMIICDYYRNDTQQKMKEDLERNLKQAVWELDCSDHEKGELIDYFKKYYNW